MGYVGVHSTDAMIVSLIVTVTAIFYIRRMSFSGCMEGQIREISGIVAAKTVLSGSGPSGSIGMIS